MLKKHAKTDQLDATTRARLPWIVPEALNRLVLAGAKLESLRRRVKQAHKLSAVVGSHRQRIQAQVRLALPAGLEEFELFTTAGRVLCTEYLDPSKVKRLGLGRLTRALQRVAGQTAGAEAAETWYRACQESLKLYRSEPPFDYEDLQDECRMEFEMLALEEQQLRRAEERVHELYRELHPSRNLESLRGVGPYVAAAAVASIGDPSRFQNARKYRAFTGMVPGVNLSGQTESKGIRISKAGPNWLKKALYLAAESARQWDPQLAKIYYDQMVKYGHHHKQAVCAVATHLADRIFVVYRDDRPYELRDLDGNPITSREAKAYIQAHLTVPPKVRKRLRNQNKGKHRPRRVRAS